MSRVYRIAWSDLPVPAWTCLVLALSAFRPVSRVAIDAGITVIAILVLSASVFVVVKRRRAR